jgi:hypothetical protein
MQVYSLYKLDKSCTGYQISLPSSSCLASLKPTKTLLPTHSNVHENIDASAESEHAGNDAKSHQVLRLVLCREQIRTVDLRQVAHSIDKCQRNGSDLRLHITKRRACETERQRIRRPETSGHKHQQHISRREVEDDAYADSCDERKGEPRGNQQTAVVRHTVRKVCCDGCTDERNGVDGRGHVLRLHAVGEAQSGHEGGVEVTEGAGSDNDLRSC